MRYILYFLVLLFLLASCTNEQSKHCNLLKHYAQELEYLELLACTEGEGQLIRSATYKVPGKQALALEKYLVKEYGMGKLVFGCRG